MRAKKNRCKKENKAEREGERDNHKKTGGKSKKKKGPYCLSVGPDRGKGGMWVVKRVATEK